MSTGCYTQGNESPESTPEIIIALDANSPGCKLKIHFKKRCVSTARKYLSCCCKTKPGRWEGTELVAEVCFSKLETRKPKSKTFRLWKKAGPRPFHFSFVPPTHMLLSSVTALQSSREKKNLALSPPDLQSKRSPLFSEFFHLHEMLIQFPRIRGNLMVGVEAGFAEKELSSCNQDRIHLKSPPLG